MTHASRMWLTWILLPCVANPSAAGVLRGSLANTGNTAGRPGEAVVWVERIPEPVERRLTRPAFRWFWQARRTVPLPRLVQANRRFAPRVLGVSNGGSVVIRNQDGVWHGTFSVSPGAPKELGKRAPGSVDTVRFSRPGVIALRCDIHPDESAFVVVTPNHAMSTTDRKGEWQLPNLPAGRYFVRAWHPDRGEIRRRVTLGSSGSTQLTLRW